MMRAPSLTLRALGVLVSLGVPVLGNEASLGTAQDVGYLSVSVARYGLITVDRPLLSARVTSGDVPGGATVSSDTTILRVGANTSILVSLPPYVLLNPAGPGSGVRATMNFSLQTFNRYIAYSPGDPLTWTVQPGGSTFAVSFSADPPAGTWVEQPAGLYSGNLTVSVAAAE